MKKTGIIVLSIVISSLVMALYVDNNRKFYNLYKIIYSFHSHDHKLKSFDYVLHSINHDNLIKAKMHIEGDGFYLNVPGFDPFFVNFNSRSIDHKKLHPTQVLALYSMGYATDYFLEKHALGEIDVNSLKEVYMLIHNMSLSPFSTSQAPFNEHAISERIQFLSLFLSYLNEKSQSYDELKNSLEYDLSLCLSFLKSEKFYIWYSNHGLMQLRALAQMSKILSDEIESEKLIISLESRITEILDFFSGEDGAVYEAASGYWMVIFDQLDKINRLNVIKNEKIRHELNTRVESIKQFISNVSLHNGFLQGTGDSYSTIIDVSRFLTKKPKKYAYSYSNYIVGLNVEKDGYVFGLMFSSLFSPPNVHKLPEDLSVFIYLNDPLIMNSGTYSYNQSESRKNFLTQGPHSVVYQSGGEDYLPLSSEVHFVTKDGWDFNDSQWYAKGSKKYFDGGEIFREVKLEDDMITILDTSESYRELETYYNINPKFEVCEKQEYKITFCNKEEKMFEVMASNKIEIVPGVYSPSSQIIDHLNRLKIYGNPITTNFYFRRSFKIPYEYINPSAENYTRDSIYYQLKDKYGIKKSKTKYEICLYFIILNLFMYFFNLYFFKNIKLSNKIKSCRV